MVSRVKLPVLDDTQKSTTTATNFVSIGNLIAKTVGFALRDNEEDADEKPGTIQVPKIEVSPNDNLNLHLLDQRLRKQLSDDPSKLGLYKSAVRAVMTSWTFLVPYTETEIIANKGDSGKQDRDATEKKRRLIERYVDVAKRFVEIVTTDTSTSEENDENECETCGRMLEDRDDDRWCPHCLRQYEARFTLKSDNDISQDGSTASSRNLGDKLNHFRLIPQLFQGTEDYDIDPDDIATIKAYAERYEIALDESLSKDTLLHILGETKLSSELDGHIYLLHKTLTGVPAPDISHIEHRILARHREVLLAFEQIKTSEHKYVLKSWYLFYQYLRMEEYDIDPRDLPLIKLKETLTWHNQTMKRIATILTKQGSRFVWNPVELT